MLLFKFRVPSFQAGCVGRTGSGAAVRRPATSVPPDPAFGLKDAPHKWPPAFPDHAHRARDRAGRIEKVNHFPVLSGGFRWILDETTPDGAKVRPARSTELFHDMDEAAGFAFEHTVLLARRLEHRLQQQRRRRPVRDVPLLIDLEDLHPVGLSIVGADDGSCGPSQSPVTTPWLK